MNKTEIKLLCNMSGKWYRENSTTHYHDEIMQCISDIAKAYKVLRKKSKHYQSLDSTGRIAGDMLFIPLLASYIPEIFDNTSTYEEAYDYVKFALRNYM